MIKYTPDPKVMARNTGGIARRATIFAALRVAKSATYPNPNARRRTQQSIEEWYAHQNWIVDHLTMLFESGK